MRCRFRGFTLTIVDLPKIEHMFLCNTSTADTVIFNDTLVAVFFAVFLSSSHSQEHAAIVYEMQATPRE
jgi:hypothetical protein